MSDERDSILGNTMSKALRDEKMEKFLARFEAYKNRPSDEQCKLVMDHMKAVLFKDEVYNHDIFLSVFGNKSDSISKEGG